MGATVRGRKPIPSAKRRLDGHPGHHPRNPHEPTLPPLAPEPPPAAPEPDADVPEELRAHPRAVAEWRRVSGLLLQAGALSDADRAALTALCLEWSRYLEAMAAVAKSGMIILSPSGYPLQNPYVAIATKALQACCRLWPELGMTPSSRTRIHAPAADDAFAEFDLPLPFGPPPDRPQ